MVGFALRIGLVAVAWAISRNPQIFTSGDTGGYVALAHALAQSGRFAQAGIPEMSRTPGYPLFMAPGAWLGHLTLITLALQLVLGVASIAMIYWLTFDAFGDRKAAVIASLLYALEPLSILYGAKLLSETLFSTLVIASAWLGIRYLREFSLRPLALGALCLAMATFTRPITEVLPFALAGLGALWAMRKGVPTRRWLLHAMAFVLLAEAPLGLWVLRNHVEGGYNGFSTITDDDLYFYKGAAVTAAVTHRGYYDVQNALGYRSRAVYFKAHPEQRGWSQARIAEFEGQQGLRVLLAHPLAYLKIHVTGWIRMTLDTGAATLLKLVGAYPLSGGGLLGYFVDHGPLKAAELILKEYPWLFASSLALAAMLLFTVALAALGLIRHDRSVRGAVLLLVAIAGYLFALSGGPESEGRFRQPIMPFVCVMAGLGAARWRSLAPKS